MKRQDKHSTMNSTAQSLTKLAIFTLAAAAFPSCGCAQTARQEELRLVPHKDSIDVMAGDKLFTTYRFSTEWVRPYFYPIHAADGRALTRGYPMDPKPGDQQDHPHHKSLWVAHGDINGTDNWSETTDKKTGQRKHGYQIARGVKVVEGKGECVSFSGVVDWVDVDKKKQLEETRTVTLCSTDAGRVVELKIDFHASEGDVTFGDTKESGLCAVRLACSMNAKADAKGGNDAKGEGRIENSEGQVYEKGQPPRPDVKGAEFVWGRRARWICFSGPVQGKPAAVTILDHPSNFRHPSYWHARGYGLCGANPFGVAAFENDKAKNGAHTLKKGAHLVLRYQVLFSDRVPAKDEIEKQFKKFAAE